MTLDIAEQFVAPGVGRIKAVVLERLELCTTAPSPDARMARLNPCSFEVVSVLSGVPRWMQLRNRIEPEARHFRQDDLKEAAGAGGPYGAGNLVGLQLNPSVNERKSGGELKIEVVSSNRRSSTEMGRRCGA